MTTKATARPPAAESNLLRGMPSRIRSCWERTCTAASPAAASSERVAWSGRSKPYRMWRRRRWPMAVVEGPGSGQRVGKVGVCSYPVLAGQPAERRSKPVGLVAVLGR